MPTAILSALPQEQSGLLAQLQQPQHLQHAGRSFWRGTLHGQRVVLALSGIGKVAAATTATALIERFGVARIVFTGVAGGVGAGVQVGDVIVAQDYVQHDMDASPLFARWELPGYGRQRLACDAALSALLLEAACACVSSAEGHFGLEYQAGRPRVHHGLVASGDRFVASAHEAQGLRAALLTGGHEVLAVEMEGAAVAQVCHDYGLPFAAMRTISDRADDSAHIDFPQFVRTVASRYAELIVQGFLKRIAA
ncbi:5'-methylthioadenosine/adenosylhomocysteine nucleosidase [Extensimonas sp. H3M7-6]|uniref:5'-methylthioadenosine/adenosylhomocysteine nucleosidase n=1 Tax=Extensimonas soli TaxID=3031322 RepID=UPI0023DBD6D0|nr:5'-methylthioadenosine/adenosylhomocysteine nucleosidase [Extensimonas sp. H3M7-6]MDF1482974.1 5'-methylthioadenosine/adenosylhomocysteine nucleosidase [Extensimonas sp. H3M7-6]